MLFTPHLAPMSRGILSTSYATPVGSPTTDEVLDTLAETYADHPFVVVRDDPPGTKETLGSNAAHVTARVDPRTGHAVVICAIDNLGKGASGQALQCANLLVGFPETTGLATVGVTRERPHQEGRAMSVTAAQGFVAAGTTAGIKGEGAADLAVVATADGAPVAAGRGHDPQRDDGRPGAGHARAPDRDRGNGCGRGAQQRQRQRRYRRAGPGRRPRDVRRSRDRRWPANPRRYWSVPPASSATGSRWTHCARASPRPWPRVRPDGGPRAAHAILTTDTVAKQSVHRVGPAVVGGMAKGAAMLRPDMATMLAVVTTDAQIEAEPLAAALRQRLRTPSTRSRSTGPSPPTTP